MAKIDLKKELADLYPTRKSATSPHLVDVPEATFLMMDGSGDPRKSKRFEQAMDALSAVAQVARSASKEAGADYSVMPMEGLWWGDRSELFTRERRDQWKWTLMIRQPDFVTARMLDHLIGYAQEQGKLSATAAADIRVKRFAEGRCAQVLHVGPYDSEGSVIDALHAFIRGQGLSPRGKHHEIYLGDPARSAPEKLKTLLRQPVQ